MFRYFFKARHNNALITICSYIILLASKVTKVKL